MNYQILILFLLKLEQRGEVTYYQLLLIKLHQGLEAMLHRVSVYAVKVGQFIAFDSSLSMLNRTSFFRVR